MPENKKYLTFDNLSRYDKKFKQWYWGAQGLGCDPIYNEPYYATSLPIEYHNLSQQYPVYLPPGEKPLPMPASYNLPMAFNNGDSTFYIRANPDQTHKLLLDNLVIKISLDPTPEYENIPDEPAGTEEDPFILYLGDATTEDDWHEFYINRNDIYIYFNNTTFVVCAGYYLDCWAPKIANPQVTINLNEHHFSIDFMPSALPGGIVVQVSSALIEGAKYTYQIGTLSIEEKNTDGTVHGVYVDNRGLITFTDTNGNVEADFTGYQTQSSGGSSGSSEYDITPTITLVQNPNSHGDMLPNTILANLEQIFSEEGWDLRDYFQENVEYYITNGYGCCTVISGKVKDIWGPCTLYYSVLEQEDPGR